MILVAICMRRFVQTASIWRLLQELSPMEHRDWTDFLLPNFPNANFYISLAFHYCSICGCSAISQQILVKSQWNTTFEKIVCSYCVPNADFYVLLAFHSRSLLSCTAIVATLCSRILAEQTIGEVCPQYNPIRFPLGAASVILIWTHSVNCLPLLLVLLLPLFLRCCCRQQYLLAAACCLLLNVCVCCVLLAA